MKSLPEPKMTVKDMIEKLKQFPEDMPIAVGYDVFDEIHISVKTWTHTNYPYDKPDFQYVCIE